MIHLDRIEKEACGGGRSTRAEAWRRDSIDHVPSVKVDWMRPCEEDRPGLQDQTRPNECGQ